MLMAVLVSAADSPSPETRSIQDSGHQCPESPIANPRWLKDKLLFLRSLLCTTLDSTVRSRARSLELTSPGAELGVVRPQGEG